MGSQAILGRQKADTIPSFKELFLKKHMHDIKSTIHTLINTSSYVPHLSSYGLALLLLIHTSLMLVRSLESYTLPFIRFNHLADLLLTSQDILHSQSLWVVLIIFTFTLFTNLPVIIYFIKSSNLSTS